MNANKLVARVYLRLWDGCRIRPTTVCACQSQDKRYEFKFMETNANNHRVSNKRYQYTEPVPLRYRLYAYFTTNKVTGSQNTSHARFMRFIYSVYAIYGDITLPFIDGIPARQVFHVEGLGWHFVKRLTHQVSPHCPRSVSWDFILFLVFVHRSL